MMYCTYEIERTMSISIATQMTLYKEETQLTHGQSDLIRNPLLSRQSYLGWISGKPRTRIPKTQQH